jgi:hypothetical protein
MQYEEDTSKYEVVIRFIINSDDVDFDEMKKDYPDLSAVDAIRATVDGIKQDLIEDGYSDCEVEVKEV